MTIGRLHILTDFQFQQRFSHAELARMMIEGGADTVQFRQKRGLLRHKLAEARRTAEVCREAGVPLIIDDHIEIALAVGASGVHIGQEDLPVPVAREIMGMERFIGATASTRDQAVRAYEEGADYLGFGPVFETYSKANSQPVRGLEALARAAAAVPIPVLAIAGVTADRVRLALDAGAHGVAVMTAVTTARDPSAAARAFRFEIDAWLRRAGTSE